MYNLAATTDRPTTTRSRSSYAEAGDAFRAMRDRLTQVQDQLPRGDLLVVLAVADYLMSYSKVTDRVSRDRIAEAVGCHPQTAGRALTRLHGLGVLTWVPATHKGGTSTLSMLPPDTAVVSGQGSLDTTGVSSLDTTVVPLPSSSSREEDKTPPTPHGPADDGASTAGWGDEESSINSVLQTYWPGLSPRGRRQCLAEAEALIRDDGWTAQQVCWLIIRDRGSARGPGVLPSRFKKAKGKTSRQFDTEWKQGRRAGGAPGQPGEFGTQVGWGDEEVTG